MGETTLFESDRTRVLRFLGPRGERLIRKELSGPEAVRRLRHEVSVLRRIAGLPGVPELAGVDEAGPAFVVADRDLAPCPAGPVPAAEAVRLGIGIATVIAGLHARGVIHKDINPSNVMLAGPERSPVLVDYDLAGTYPVERPSFTHHTDISGTLAYLAPEQSGRTGWPVDQRADLYALGATLYELATGRPPFGDGDPLRLVRDHLIREPDDPAELVPGLPAMLGPIIGRLLEKDPERRYQSADGVRHDLTRLRDLGEDAFPLGERDFPWQLTAPSRLVGRAEAVAEVGAALDAAIHGSGSVLLVSGASGVGKTVLIDELRPLVTAADGWFVSGKYDQYRQDPDADGLRQAFRGLARMLLAEPEEELLRIRSALRGVLRGNAGLVAAIVPEFAALLDVAPEAPAGDLTHVQARLNRAAGQVLRVVADPRRPLVLVVDDLQWGRATSAQILDLLVTGGGLRGVLVVGAYRDSEVDAVHPLTAVLDRWGQRPDPPPHVRLTDLRESGVRELAEGVLRGPVDRGAELAELISAHTGGNPFATVEFVNALRRGGALTPGAGGWRFDPGASWLIGRPADVAALLCAQVKALPRAARTLVEILSCLSGDADPEVVESLGDPTADLLEVLRPALEAGMLLLDGAELRFRHDQIRQAVYGGMPAPVRVARHLRIARRLAGRPGYAVVAAEQYLAAFPAIASATEADRVAALLRDAALYARTMSNYPAAERFLTAAAALAGRAGDPLADWRLDAERQGVFLALGRYAESDELFRRIGDGCPDPLVRAASALVQTGSLVRRNRPVEALAVGCASLGELGHPVPDAGRLAEQLPHLAAELAAWSRVGGAEADLRRGRTTDPLVTAAGTLMSRLVTAAFFAGSPLLPWLIVTAARIWTAGGPAPALTGPLANAMIVTVEEPGGFATGYAVTSRMVAVSEALGDEPDASYARFLHALTASHWFESLSETLSSARTAHERLVQAGDLYNAGFAWYAISPIMIDCADLAAYRADSDRGLAFAATTGHDQIAHLLRIHRAVPDVLGPGTATMFDQDTCPPEMAGNVLAESAFHLLHAFTALVLGDAPGVTRHIARALAGIGAFATTSLAMIAHLVQALALADRAGPAPEADRAGLIREFDRHRAWIAGRAADAPGNYGHLDSWLRAERARATGDLVTAARAFDTAESDTESRQRPWHRALLAERHARLLLADGLEYNGRLLLRQAAARYAQWGADRKVAGLRAEFPFLDAAGDPSPGGRRSSRGGSATISAETIDLLAVLRACQAISSETGIERLTAQVNDLLCGLTGATAAQLILRDRDGGDWLPPESGPIPLTVLRYVERTREPLVVDDAKRDDRFALDPVLRPIDRIALLAVPILAGGEVTAMLLLENRDSRGAFGVNRLETVSLLAGQLSVSVHNALLYGALERRVADRTQALAEANAKLEILAGTDPLTGLPNRRRLAQPLGSRQAAVAMVDVDHFKLYNDRYGHPAGDECLRLVAHTISANVRETDVVVRYGGEEFAVILDDADEVTALAVAERIRAAIERLAQPHAAAPSGRLTVSIGVAAGEPVPGDAPDTLLGAADAGLYAAKAAGRNRVAQNSGR